MLKLIKYSKDVPTYMFPSGTIATHEEIEKQFPAVSLFTHVLEINGNICQSVMELSALREIHNIDSALTDDEAIREIETIRNTPQPAPEPSAEERMAASMEFQNLTLINTEEDVTVQERIAAALEFLAVNSLSI